MDKITYAKLKQGEIVFHQNDVGKEFYIVLTGRVWVLYNKTVDKSISNQAYIDLKNMQI